MRRGRGAISTLCLETENRSLLGISYAHILYTPLCQLSLLLPVPVFMSYISSKGYPQLYYRVVHQENTTYTECHTILVRTSYLSFTHSLTHSLSCFLSLSPCISACLCRCVRRQLQSQLRHSRVAVGSDLSSSRAEPSALSLSPWRGSGR